MALYPPEFRTRHLDRRAVLILTGLMLGVILFSVFFLANQSLRLDEAQSLWQSSHTPAGILKVVASDVHVPLHHFMLHYWQIWFGHDVPLDRDLSLIFFVLTIPAVYMLANLSFSRSVAIFVAIMVAASPFLNWYGSEIRMYSLLTFLTVLNQYFFILLFKKRPVTAGTWWGYGLTAFFGSFTHYFFALVLFVELLFFLLNRRLFPPDMIKKLIIIGIIIALFMGPWLYYVFSLKALGNSEPNLMPPTTVNFFNSYSQFVFGFQDDQINTILVSLWPLSVLLAFLALKRSRKFSPDAAFFLMAAVVPVLVAFLVSVYVLPLFVSRYLILAVPSLYLFLGWVISGYPRPIRNITQFILIAAMCVLLAQEAFSSYTPVKEDYREATDYLNENATAQDVIVLSAPFTIYPVLYYYTGPAEVTTLPIWNRYQAGAIPAFDPNTLPSQVNQIKGDHEDLWLLLSYDQGYQKDIQLYFDSHFQRLGEFDFSPGVSLYEYKLRYP